MQPIYPNCFDMLTTNGIIHDDLVGYVTGTQSPYLQNYVTQYGAKPPQMPQQPLNDVYQQPQTKETNAKISDLPDKATKKSNKSNIWKSLAMSVILSVGLSLLITKCIRKINGIVIPSSPKGAPWYQRFIDLFKI